MMLPVHLQRSAVAAIVDCPVRGQFTGSRSLKPVAPQLIWLFQESLSTARIRLVLHLEQPAKHSKMFPRAINPANVRLKLRKRLKAIDPHPIVVEKVQ